jgi:hypothetical protein
VEKKTLPENSETLFLYKIGIIEFDNLPFAGSLISIISDATISPCLVILSTKYLKREFSDFTFVTRLGLSGITIDLLRMNQIQ